MDGGVGEEVVGCEGEGETGRFEARGEEEDRVLEHGFEVFVAGGKVGVEDLVEDCGVGGCFGNGGEEGGDGFPGQNVIDQIGGVL